MFKKIILSFIVLFTVLPFLSLEAKAATTQEGDCLILLLDRVSDISGGNSFATLISHDFSKLQPLLLSQYVTNTYIFNLDFKAPIFSQKYYRFGDRFGVKYLEAFPYRRAVNFGNKDLTNDYLTSFAIYFDYDKDDNSLVECRAVTTEIRKAGLTAAAISADDIGMAAPLRVKQFAGKDVESLESNGVKYKRIVVEKDIMNQTYSVPTYTEHIVSVFPESERRDFNPYALVDRFAQLVSDYYDKLIPKMQTEIADSSLSKVVLSSGKVVVNGYQYKNGSNKFVAGFLPRTYNGSLTNGSTYNQMMRYYLANEMLRSGQADFINLWLSNLCSWSDTITKIIKGDISSSDVTTSSDANICSNGISNKLDYYIDVAIGIAQSEGIAEPNKTDDVKLFWRIKQLVDKGVSIATLRTYITNYPAYLQDVAENEKKIAEIAKTKSSDIEKGSWYANFVYELMSWGVLSGYPDGTYRPSSLVNRAEVAKIAVALFNLSLPSKITSDPFPDVPKDAWFAPFVVAAKLTGAIDGYPDGNFRPGGYVNRAEAMKMLATASGVKLTATSTPIFPDVSGREWYSLYVNFAGKSGVVNGYTDGKFRPGNNINRAEIAKMAAQARKILVEK
ncbi:MAG: S-layer homology domain-containing protein [Candidatus Gracilibacteria bacterium]|nr:S-layer homology domain-containing protein [Candidatus Gracilibacteria bacterium]MDD5179519.1 S-layer homology domain-containing protein [Candidatus Gracilibacteria bacterium]